MNRAWRWVLPCYVFALPMTVAGFVVATLVYRARNWQWYDGVLCCIAGRFDNGVTRIWGRPNAQTLGWIEIYDSEDSLQETDIRVHENVHVVQAFVCGLLGLALCPLLFLAMGWSPLLGLAVGGFVGSLGFAALYGILFLYLLLRHRAGWYPAYMANPFEVQAYKLQDQYIANPSSRPWGA